MHACLAGGLLWREVYYVMYESRAVEQQQEGRCLGRNDIYVKTVVLISFDALTSMLKLLRMLPSRSQCPPLIRTVHIALRTRLLVVGTDRLIWQFFVIEVQSLFYLGNEFWWGWDFRFSRSVKFAEI